MLPGHTAHVPDEPHADADVPDTQLPDEQQKPPAQVPLVVEAPPHAAVQLPEVQVGVPFAQVAQRPPFNPHAPFAVPVAHWLFEPQHPPLQDTLALH